MTDAEKQKIKLAAAIEHQNDYAQRGVFLYKWMYVIGVAGSIPRLILEIARMLISPDKIPQYFTSANVTHLGLIVFLILMLAGAIPYYVRKRKNLKKFPQYFKKEAEIIDIFKNQRRS
jgi:hypothetical protein